MIESFTVMLHVAILTIFLDHSFKIKYKSN